MSKMDDGKISHGSLEAHAMARLVAIKDQYRVCLLNDMNVDCHGIVTPGSDLINRITIGG